MELFPAYQLATVDKDGNPHVRTHIHRDFVSTQSFPSLPLLLTTTDVRTPKAMQILANHSVEVVWWLAPTNEQFRIAGRATLIPAPSDGLHDADTSKLAQIADGKFAQESFDWEKRRIEAFEGVGPVMRASWCRPTPGVPMPGSGTYDEAKKWPQKLPSLEEAKDGEERALVEAALKNFALVVIDPEDVDYVELGVVPNQRTRFIRKGDHWDEQILVP
jgi:pyridoxamine 5'-phosphate oxidase